MNLSQSQRDMAVELFRSVQNRLLAAFEKIDGGAKAERKPWQKGGTTRSGEDTGGGTIGVLRGKVVEKAGANVSAVRGDEYPAIEGEHKGKPFFAAGVSTICHMYNPMAPIAHMNVRLLQVGDQFWVGGGADLTPFKQFDEDTKDFHQAMANACRSPDEYKRFKEWCDEYFFIKHRNSARGVGGIFFDYLTGDFSQLLSLLTKVTDEYLRVYPAILERRARMEFSEADKEAQLFWRGRYAEFNLVYDRGTKFGLMTGGNIDAIFVSMPPVVKW
jgi:coproporphyrinogen III oxidase